MGFVDDDPDKRDLYVEGRRVLGTRADIPRLVEAHNVDLIVLAVHNISGPAFREVLAYCEATGARIKVIPDAYAWMTATEGVGLLRDVQAEDILGRSPVGRHEAVDFEPVTGRRILVTGAAGSIGSELSRQLLQYSPVALLLLDNNESALHDLPPCPAGLPWSLCWRTSPTARPWTPSLPGTGPRWSFTPPPTSTCPCWSFSPTRPCG